MINLFVSLEDEEHFSSFKPEKKYKPILKLLSFEEEKGREVLIIMF